MKKTPDITIVIVNTNDILYTKDCLKSLSYQKGQLETEIWVVDNASTDGSVAFIKNSFPEVKLIKNRTNLYYTIANNRGLKKVRGKYFLILNPDTRLRPTTLSRMYEFLEMHSRVGLAACRQINESGKTLPVCHRFFTPLTQMLLLPIFNKFAKNSFLLQTHHYSEWNRKSTRQVDTIPGSFMFGRSRLLKKVGLLDEAIPMFYSDDDYCLRVKQHGYEIWYQAGTTITHLTSKTISRFPYRRVAYQGYQDLTAYFRKHYGYFWAIVFYILTRLNVFVSIIYPGNYLPTSR